MLVGLGGGKGEPQTNEERVEEEHGNRTQAKKHKHYKFCPGSTLLCLLVPFKLTRTKTNYGFNYFYTDKNSQLFIIKWFLISYNVLKDIWL